MHLVCELVSKLARWWYSIYDDISDRKSLYLFFSVYSLRYMGVNFFLIYQVETQISLAPSYSLVRPPHSLLWTPVLQYKTPLSFSQSSIPSSLKLSPIAPLIHSLPVLLIVAELPHVLRPILPNEHPIPVEHVLLEIPKISTTVCVLKLASPLHRVVPPFALVKSLLVGPCVPALAVFGTIQKVPLIYWVVL